MTDSEEEEEMDDEDEDDEETLDQKDAKKSACPFIEEEVIYTVMIISIVSRCATFLV